VLTGGVPAGFGGRNTGAEIGISNSGHFVYTSNRGHDSIAVFSVNPTDHSLRFVETMSAQGKTPTNFALDPSGAYLVAGNEGSDSMVVFRVDQETGHLTPTGEVELNVLGPACLLFVPAQ